MTNCPACSTPVTAGQKFCMECGTRLEVRCPSCDKPVVAGARFCGECGTPLETASESPSPIPAEAVPERRLVTVLFADMVGYSSMSESRDPEEVRDFLSTYFTVARDVVGRYGGTVDKFIGDAVMGVWGTPIAHEDDAERAVRAALDLTAEVGSLGERAGIPDIAVRVGVATGEAAVFLNAPAGEGMAGDLVNTASRLEGAARPGTVLVNDGTYRAASRAISFEDVGDLMLKGKSVPVHAWRPLQVTAKVGGARGSTLPEPPFVGRNRELQTLRDIFKRSAAEGRAHLVSVIGVAGIGKSRLVDELEKHLDGLVETTYWHRGRSPSYGEGVTFWALGEMVRARAQIADADDDETQRTKLTSAVDEFVEPVDRAWVQTALEVLLGLRPPGTMEPGEAESAWRRFFEAIASRAPTVMVFEDIHWADTGTIEFVEAMLGWSARHPLFIVTLARPELLERWPTWGAGLSGFTGLALEPLEDAEVDELLDGFAPGLPIEIRRAVRERSEGIPLYVVETVRMLADSGSLESVEGRFAVNAPVDLAVPESLHALVAARLDSLGVDDRRLIQHAAVLGQSFEQKTLAEVTGIPAGDLGPRLDRLVVRQLLRVDDDPRSVERGFHQFVQSVIREVALGMISRSERRQLHVRIADHFESVGDVELLPVVVHHLTEAMRLGSDEEASTLAERAFEMLAQAAQRAGSLGSHDQEVSFLERALPLAPDGLAGAQLTRRLALAAQQAGLSERAMDAWRSAHEQYAELDEFEDEAVTAAGLANWLMMSGFVDEAGALLDEALERAVLHGVSTGAVASLHAQRARVGGFSADGPRAIAEAERALELAAEAGRVDIVADALITRGWGLLYSDREHEAVALTRGALALAIKYGAVEAEFRARNNLGAFLLWSDPAEVLALMRDGIEISLRRGDVETHAGLAAKALETATSLGEWDWALELLETVVRSGVSTFATDQLDAIEMVLRSMRGEFDRVDELMRTGLEASEKTESVQAKHVFHIYAGIAEAARGHFDEALHHTTVGDDLIVGIERPRLALVALQVGDDDLLADALSKLEATPKLDDRTALWVEALHAAVALRQGEDAAAERGLGVASQLRDAGLIVDAAQWFTELAVMLPQGDPGRGHAATEAREIWAGLGAHSMLDQLDRRMAD
ncbi:MAG: AAA family ATPase [Acidimicrobiia bacterium]|nr:AAA family ATPase [Acidimicrobiia bacterium]